jgi:Protein of unknown function (DUF1441)
MSTTNKSQSLARGVHVSISAMANEVGHARETIRKRLADAGVKSSGERSGNPLYRLRDMLRALNQTTDGKRDPDKLPPFERHAHFKAEHAKICFERELRQLIPAAEVERGYAHIFKTTARVFDTLPDTLERDCGLSPAALVVVEKHLDAARVELHAELNRSSNEPEGTENIVDGDSECVGDFEASSPGEA